jgi:hypothetical protein
MNNYYDDSKITEQMLKMARKVKMTCKKLQRVTEKVMPNVDQEHWQIDFMYKGRKFEGAIYLLPLGLSDSPRIEYVLNSLFANAVLYDKYQKRIFDFIHDFPGLTSDFESAQTVLDSTQYVSVGLHDMLKDDYELYKSEFVKINAFDRIF